MRKALIAFCLLFALAVGGIITIHSSVNAVRDQVVITEEIRYGDKAAAEGLTILTRAALDNGHLNWDTSYTIGAQPVTHTDFDYSHQQKARYSNDAPLGLVVGSELNSHSSDWTRAAEASEVSGLNLAYWELMQDTPAGEEGERTIRIADYYDYYPLDFVLELPNYALHRSFGEISMARSPEQMDNMELVYQALSDYWKIPVLPEQTMFINLQRREESGVSGWGSGMGEGVWYEPWAQTTATDDACYFVVNNRDTDDRVMDFSQVPGGYGIHMISYEYNPTEAGTMVDPDSLRMVYPLDEACQVLWLDNTEDNKRILLITLEANGDTLLRVIECGSMDTLQEIVLYAAEQGERFGVAECMENVVLIRSGDGRITLLEEQSGGIYDVVIDIPVSQEQQISYGFHTFHWNGEKLVLAYPWDQVEWQSGDNCGFGVAVYDKTGALFVGKYTSSLDTKTFSPYAVESCFLWSYDPLCISWE